MNCMTTRDHLTLGTEALPTRPQVRPEENQVAVQLPRLLHDEDQLVWTATVVVAELGQQSRRFAERWDSDEADPEAREHGEREAVRERRDRRQLRRRRR